MVDSPPSCPPFSEKCLGKIQNSAISYVRVNLFQLFDATGFYFGKENAAMTKPKLIEEPSICNFLPDKKFFMLHCCINLLNRTTSHYYFDTIQGFIIIRSQTC